MAKPPKVLSEEEEHVLKARRAASRLTLAIADPTQKATSIARAISLQLVRDRHWPPANLNARMDQNYNYDRNTIGNFLLSVRETLRTSKPAYNFEFDDSFLIKALPMTVAALGGTLSARAKEHRR